MKWQNWVLIAGFILAVASFYMAYKNQKNLDAGEGSGETNEGSGSAGLAAPIF